MVGGPSWRYAISYSCEIFRTETLIAEGDMSGRDGEGGGDAEELSQAKDSSLNSFVFNFADS